MNQEANNEIDLMLRKLGRQSNNLPTEVEHGAAEEHLDADELNMYAENALPANARARYTEHLADCSRCRQIVSRLTMAAGVVIEERKAGVPAPSGIKALLAGFFSPMFLRYAVPTLGLVLITAVAFMVFKDSGSKQAAIDAQNAQTSVAKNDSTSALADKAAEGLSNTSQPTYAVKVNPSPPQGEETTRAKAGETDAAKETAANKRDESPTTVDQVAAAPPASVGGNVSQPAPKPAVADDKATAGRDVAEKKRQPEEPSAADAQVAEAAAKSEAKAEGQKKIALAEAARSMPAKAKSAPATRGQEESEAVDRTASGRRADKDESETRSVAGRKFRRAGSAWIDTAYSSQATTNVTRGSEQYRALIADEPSIRTIADQLDGEVIVVWKSRAYKIR